MIVIYGGDTLMTEPQSRETLRFFYRFLQLLTDFAKGEHAP